MKNLKVTAVAGTVPMNLVTGIEFEEAIENLVVLMRTAGATGITANIDATGKITMSIEGIEDEGKTNSITMEADEL